MRRSIVLAGAAVALVLAFNGEVTSQETSDRVREQESAAGRVAPQGAAPDRVNEILQLIRLEQAAELDRLNRCTLSDGTIRRLNESVVFRGWTYRCVEILDSNLVRSGIGWTRILPVDDAGARK